MKSVVHKLEVLSPEKEKPKTIQPTNNENSNKNDNSNKKSDSKGPLNWKEDSSENDLNFEDINRFINMRKDLLENDFSFKLTKTERKEENQQPSGKNKTTDNVFHQVLGKTLLKAEDSKFKDTFLRTEDYELSMTEKPDDRGFSYQA